MEKRFQLTQLGQQVIQADLNTIADEAALADDRVLAELFKLTPYDGVTVSRGISLEHVVGLLLPNGATGTIAVQPFRAYIGSRTLVGTDAKANLRDIRSAICIGATAQQQSVSIAANSSGNSRWDVIWAAVAIDANQSTVSRKVKDQSSGAVTTQTVVTYQQSTVTLGVTAGTPSATPSMPSVPADAGGTYYIALGYVLVTNGWSAGSTASTSQIFVTAPVLHLRGASLRPASMHYTPGSACLTNARIQGGLINDYCTFLPSNIGPGGSVLIAIKATVTNPSISTGAIVDNAIDWRNRYFRWHVSIGTNSLSVGGIQGGTAQPSYGSLNAPGSTTASFSTGMGNSFAAQQILVLSGSAFANMADAATFDLSVDGSGNLTANWTGGTPDCVFFIWLEYSGKMS